MKEHFRESYEGLAREHWWFRARRRILEQAVEGWIPRPTRALAIGIGGRAEAEMLTARFPLTAVELAPLDPELAEITTGVRADAVALPFESGGFDTVFLFDVLEHIEDHEAAAREIHRVLRPGGHCLISVPAFQSLFGPVDYIAEHKRRYRKRELENLLGRCGFRIEHSTYFNTVLFPPIALIRILRRALPAPKNETHSDFDLRLPERLERVLESIFALERHMVGRIPMPFGISLLCSISRS